MTPKRLFHQDKNKAPFILEVELFCYIFLFIYYIFFFLKFTLENTSNILFWEQWGNLPIVIGKLNLLELISYKDGGQPIGFGILLVKLLASISKWNVYYETIFTSLVFLINCLLLLHLKKTLFNSFKIYDIFVPLIYLNLNQWDSLINGNQLTYILSTTFLLIFLNIICFKNASFYSKLSLLLLISVISSKSAVQGLIVSFLILIYLVLLILHRQEKKYIAIAILSTIVTFIPFIVDMSLNYSKYLASNSFPTISYIIKHLYFQINGAVGYTPNFSPLIFFFPAIILASVIILLIEAVRKRELMYFWFPLVSLYVYPFIFSLLTALSRAGLGLSNAQSSRYIPHVMFYFIGFIFFMEYLIKNNRRQVLKVLNFAFISFLVVLILRSQNPSIKEAAATKSYRESWIRCYKDTKSVEICNDWVGYKIYPPSNDQLEKYLAILKRKNLNIFAAKQ